MARCNMCRCELTNDENSLNYDCGGDCLLCMADCGDTDCVKTALKIAGVLNEEETNLLDKSDELDCDNLFRNYRNTIRDRQATNPAFKEKYM